MKNYHQIAFGNIAREEANPEGGDTGNGADNNAPDDPIAKKIADKLDAAKKAYQEIHDKVSEIDSEGKQLAEDFAQATKNFDGLDADIKHVITSQKKLEQKVARERRRANGDPIRRISEDEQLRAVINGVVRVGAKKRGFINVDIPDEHIKAAEDYAAFQRAVTTGSSPGSTYIDDDLNPELYSLIASYGVWNMFDVQPATTKTTKLITDDTDPVMGFQLTEGSANSEVSYTGSTASVSVEKMLGWLGVTTEALEDAELDLSGLILRKFRNATAYRMDWICLSADGTSDATDGGFTGLFQGGTASGAASGNVSVATLDLLDWQNTMLAADATVLERPSRWWMHPQMLVRTLSIKDLNGRPIFQNALDAPAPGAIGSILGSPVTLSQACPNTDSTSSEIAAFGDPEGQAVLLRRDFNFAASEHALFTADKVVFRATARAASKTRKATSFGVLTTAAS